MDELNDQILDSIENTPGARQDDSSFHFTIGDTFYVMIEGWHGSECLLDPLPQHLKDWPAPAIKLYYYDSSLPPSDWQDKYIVKASVGASPGSSMFTQSLDLEINQTWFPHRALYPNKEEGFKDQVWAKPFFNNNVCEVNKTTLCDILQYCCKMANLKVFW